MELHVLIDFENVQPSFEDVNKLAPSFTDVWLFHGPQQIKIAQQWASMHERVTLVPISKSGKNALDFHLTFYLGYVAAKHPVAHLVVVANDKGYDPMIVHAKMLNFTVKRVGYKTKAVATKVAPPAAKKSTSTAKVMPPKKAVPSKKTPTVVKKAAEKKPPAKKTSVKKSVSPKTPMHKVPIQSQTAVSLEDKELIRIQKGLSKMGDKAPHRLKSFLRHISALLGKESTSQQTDAVVHNLEKAGVVSIAGDLVLYPSI
jgi:PIN domain